MALAVIWRLLTSRRQWKKSSLGQKAGWLEEGGEHGSWGKNRSSLKDEGPASGMCYDTLGW